MTALIELAERVEAADGPSLVLDRDIALAIYPDARPTNVDARISVWDGNGRTQITVKPYTASIDAAMQLVPEGYGLSLYMAIGKKPSVRMWREEVDILLNASTPALAIVAAALRAKAGVGV